MCHIESNSTCIERGLGNTALQWDQILEHGKVGSCRNLRGPRVQECTCVGNEHQISYHRDGPLLVSRRSLWHGLRS